MAYRIMKSKITDRKPKILGATNGYRYTFKNVTYSKDTDTIVDYNQQPLTLEAYSKEDLVHLVSHLLHTVSNQPVINEVKLCESLNKEYKTPEDILTEKYGALAKYLNIGHSNVTSINTGHLEFDIESEMDDIVYTTYNTAKDSLMRLIYAKKKTTITEEEMALIYAEFLDEMLLINDQLLDVALEEGL